MNIQLSSVTEQEHMLFFSQNDRDKLTGCIGHLRGDFDSGRQFYTSWTDHNSALKNDEFKMEFDNIINFLRTDTENPILKSRADMEKYCYQNSDNRIVGAWHKNTYGFKITTDHHSFYIRCFPQAGDNNFYVYCYDNSKLLPYLSGDLPEYCMTVLPSSGTDCVLIKKGVKGYFPYQTSENAVIARKCVDYTNQKKGVTRAQEEAMLAGSMVGNWDAPAADPRNYDENGKPLKPKNKDLER